MTSTAPTSALATFELSLTCFKRDHQRLSPELQAVALTSWRKQATPNLWKMSEADRRDCYTALKKLAIELRLTWDDFHKPPRYVPPLSDGELDFVLARIVDVPQINHLVQHMYWKDCHTIAQWIATCECAKRLGAGWSKEGKRFVDNTPIEL